jgi:ubiquinone/menaquinone biosynthesis C-methylase UbiE
MKQPIISDLHARYDGVANEYARRIYDELRHKPLDRQLLDRFAESQQGGGLTCDIATGPGHVARYLHDRGVRVCGIDLSAQIVERARRLNPGIEFRHGDMFALDFPDQMFTGITGFYALVNIPRPEVVRVLRELRRVLKPGGLLLLAFHIGDPVLRRGEWWGAEVSRYFYFFRSGEMSGYLKTADFEIDESIERNPYPEIEQQNRRGYVLARKPALPRHDPPRSLHGLESNLDLGPCRRARFFGVAGAPG